MADKQSRRRQIVSDTVLAAFISAVAVLVGVWLTQNAALDQQEASFEHQRELADHDELRRVLDDSVVALDRLRRVALEGKLEWERTGRRLPRTSRLDAAFNGASGTGSRLDIRLLHTDAEAAYTRALDAAAAMMSLMVQSPPTAKNRARLDKLATEEFIFQLESFVSASQHILAGH